MSDFDIARIVPSIRDFAGAVRTQRDGLALVPLVPAEDADAHVRRLTALDVRAFASRDGGEPLLLAARAAESKAIALLAVAGDVEACQRARFYGADAVAVEPAAYAALRKTVQSMRMMPIAVVSDETGLGSCEARVLLLRGSLERVLALAAVVEKNVITVAEIADANGTALRHLSGQVDAAIVPVAVHESAAFESLLDELDS